MVVTAFAILAMFTKYIKREQRSENLLKFWFTLMQPDDERSIVCWQAKAMVHLPEQAITSRFIKTGTQRYYGIGAPMYDDNPKIGITCMKPSKRACF